MEYTYTVIYEPAEDDGYLVHVPALNGATTHGTTKAEARAMAKDMIQGYIESLLKGGQLPPEESKGAYRGERVTVKIRVSVTV
ncbi:MAG: hypothetical protein A2Z21_03575 [Candidatus Fraserbacteria bacterium RBG_16_55_9]|uniref:HicB-like antitoxin of toxin-antitoxin system domain-containing protein n=1 Tax=Fraserbacteria sp. (strain RBG_16_55_9) TaxID=1817864 RepID=A0A1F5V0H3_FRAXR|nr:MAG: hypothetical protein A2Z21_03575 [Candidatus Fraserbacteria bacterium RBG_16_55_9]